MAGGIVSQLVDWALAVFGPLGAPGLFFVALTEAVVSPIPIEPVMVPFVLDDPAAWPFWGAVASAGSITGSLVGYVVGKRGGQPLLVRIVGERKAEDLHRYYERWGAGAVFVTGITPMPYKVFTIGSGVLDLDIRKFTVAAVLGRGIRFMAIAWAASVYGQQVLDLADRYVWHAVAVAAVILGVWAFVEYRRWRERREEE